MATKLASPFMIPNRPFMQPALPCLKRWSGGLSVAASKGTNGRDYEGKLVDENMIELRIRIQEMKMLEMGDEQPPSDWMEWEKDYFEYYKEDVCEGIGLLQNWLMNVRPSLALGFVALVSLSLPISSGLVFFRVLELSKLMLSGFHLGSYFY
ncbi:uncharacterized protein LOC132803508 [Ziziphus jujuba]|uniref:Uncharacterized protein LOC132803508 n=2 Tax=Ziziphus jujuba TaxID=326968 RepID=A0ABM4A7G6_ZIZJJ|nr:uncharacterized protein LOC132803508 [Ziziphus jujuba]KAH7533870.1 hypothetical protein FEM48_Zijuj04G0177600 [Ziziphus jujuba var. spinosa]